ncbi:MAG: hypothetical protein ACREN4_06435 [Candidatus Dormibacteria bacterium]
MSALALAVYGPSAVSRDRRTRAELDAIDQAIVEAVDADAPVTLRGVYYRVVSAGAVDKTEAGYRLVGRELLKLRRSGGVDYADITDGTRWVTKPTSWSGLEAMLEDAAVSYRRALWRNQKAEVHLFTEKDAISGILLPITERWDVGLGVLRGTSSESFTWSVAQAVLASPKEHIYLYQLGDHDPSGVDAWRAFRERLVRFLGQEVTQEAIDLLFELLHYVPEGIEVGKPAGVHLEEDDELFDGDELWDDDMLGEVRGPVQLPRARRKDALDHLRAPGGHPETDQRVVAAHPADQDERFACGEVRG